MYSRARCQTSQFGNWFGFAEFLSCVQISCQWGCGTYFDSFVAKFVATCVWNGYQISEINLFVSSCLRCLQEATGLPGAAAVHKERSGLVWWPAGCTGHLSKACVLVWMPGMQSQVPKVAILYQSISERPGFLQQEAGIHMNVDVRLGVAVLQALFAALRWEPGASQTGDRNLTRQEACISFLLLHFLLVLLGTTVFWWALPESSRRVAFIATSTLPGNLLDIFSPPTSSQIYWIRDCKGRAQPSVL